MMRANGRGPLLLVLIAALLMIGACSKPRIDTSSDEKMGASIAKVRSSLPPEKLTQFDEAWVAVAMQGFTVPGIMSTATAANMTAAVKERLNGKTGDEVIAEAAKIKAKAEAKAKEEAKAEIAKLEKAKTEVDAAKAQMVKFEIIDAKFRQTKDFIGMMQPEITMTVKNGTPYPVSRAYFVGILTSPGRSVPWLRKEFNYSISGGIEPGEQATWNLTPNQFSEWGSVKPDKDAGLKVEVVGLDGPDSKRLFTDAKFDDEDAARLVSLKKQFGL
jgi:uncharacterized protein DUF6694